MQGFRPAMNETDDLSGLGLINHAFPNSIFPIGATHEFFCSNEEQASASCGFISGILASLMKKGGVSLWISSSCIIFPPALKSFGIEPEHIIFLGIKKDKNKLEAIEEALKCDGLTAVIGEVNEISFTASRRFQLAVENSHVTGFFIRRQAKNLSTSCVSKWRIRPAPCVTENDMPGLGFPRWNVELLKVRNGRTGNWLLEWNAGNFKNIPWPVVTEEQRQRKTG